MDTDLAVAASTDLSAEAGRAVVWFAGECDTATAPALSGALAWAVALERHHVVVDLSGVEFMDASTVGVIVKAADLLRARRRSLTVRSPSRAAERILDICGLSGLIEAESPGPQSRADARSIAIARRI